MDGYNGVLFEPGNARDLARAIRLLLAAPAQSEAMGRNGQQQVYEIWNNDSQTADLLSFYEQLCKR
jgi:glycosyltransferase involved in cell wall biosynthesis